MIWFTADQHFDHENIIEYCKRPFNKLHVMNRTIIGNFNAKVGHDDITYHLGDFTLRGPENINLIKGWVKRLNGNHVLILGNHDKLNPFSYIYVGFQSVHTYLCVEGLHLTHDPAITVVNRSVPWLCGHIHTLFEQSMNVTNVGVDVHNFYPVSIDRIKGR